MMKVTQTLQATDNEGNLVPYTKPVEMTWYKGDSPVKVAAAVAQILADNEDRRFTATVAITVYLV